MIECKELTKRYGAAAALEGVSFALPEDGIVALVGNNGAGKTTLLSLIAGYLRPTEGGVLVNGRDPAKSREAAGSLVMVDEKMDYDFLFSLKRILKQYEELDEDFCRQKAERILDRFEMPDKRKYRQLSKGMRNQFNIAVGLALNRRITLMDEPASGLDEGAREAFYELLVEEYCDRGGLYLVSTHLLGEFQSVCDRLMVLRKGRLAEYADREAFETRMVRLEGSEAAVSRMTERRRPYKRACVMGVASAVVDGDLSREEKRFAKENGVEIRSVSVGECCIQLCREEKSREADQ